MTIVYKFGARNPEASDRMLFMEQMRLGHDYYNTLVEARNAQMVEARGTPAPPHENCEIKNCPECRAYWKTLRDRVKEAGFLDRKPYRAAYIQRGLYWGTYLGVEDAFSRAEKDTGLIAPMKFRSWIRSRHLCQVQIQDPKRADNFFRIEELPCSKTGRRKGQRRLLFIRVGSEGRLPIWAKIPYIEHRPIEGRVRWVALRHETVCGRDQWSVAFTCSDEAPRRRNVRRGSIVAVDVGWRKMEDESIRVAFAQSDRGEIHELRLSSRWSGRTKLIDDLRSIRQQNLNDLLLQVDLGQVRSAAGVVRKFREDDCAHKERLSEWLKRDRHLWQYQTGNERRAVLHRQNELRVFARELWRRYETVIVKDSSHKEIKEEKSLPRPARRQGHHAAPGEVVEWFKAVFGEHVIVVSAPWTSCICTCGAVCEPFAGLLHVCESCGAKTDRDIVSTRNMLTLSRTDPVQKGTSRKRSAKFAKRHQKQPELS